MGHWRGHQGPLVYTDAFPNAPLRKGEGNRWGPEPSPNLETIRAGNQARVGLSTPPTSLFFCPDFRPHRDDFVLDTGNLAFNGQLQLPKS